MAQLPCPISKRKKKRLGGKGTRAEYLVENITRARLFIYIYKKRKEKKGNVGKGAGYVSQFIRTLLWYVLVSFTLSGQNHKA